MGKMDIKQVLAMFQQSKMQAEESMDKDRMAEINRQIEERRLQSMETQGNLNRGMEESRNIANQVIRHQDIQAANIREDSQLAYARSEHAKDRDVTNNHYMADVERQKANDILDDKLGWFNARTERMKAGIAKTDKESPIEYLKAQSKLQGEFRNEVAAVLSGASPDGKGGWIPAPEGDNGINLEDDPKNWGSNSKANMANVNKHIKVGQNFVNLIQKYRSNLYDVDTNEPVLMKQYGDYLKRFGGGKQADGSETEGWAGKVNDHLIGPSTFGTLPSGMLNLALNKVADNPDVPVAEKHAAYNQLTRIASMLQNVPVLAPGARYDAKSKRFVPGP